MSDPTRLLRNDLRDFAGYASARRTAPRGHTWLNANEAPVANASDSDRRFRRYPEPQPPALVAALADLYGVAFDNVLACRGSDEAIDLLVRAFCMPGQDAVAVTPPVFGMYAVSARLQGTRVLDVPAVDTGDRFDVDLASVATTALEEAARIVFLCSPGNPTGASIDGDAIVSLARSLERNALVVVDEAYGEFASTPSLAPRVADTPNLVVLRTLSKAHALAGARIGCAIADPRVAAAVGRCQAPYPIPAASSTAALAALQAPALEATRRMIAMVRKERTRVRDALAGLPIVRTVYPSDANFLLVRFNDSRRAWDRLVRSGVIVRDMRAEPGLEDALRITIGTAGDNARLLEALA